VCRGLPDDSARFHVGQPKLFIGYDPDNIYSTRCFRDNRDAPRLTLHEPSIETTLSRANKRITQ